MVFHFLSAAGAAEPACTSQSDSKTKSHIKRLKEDLFQDYDSSVRPVRMRADRTEVAVEMIPLSVAFVSSQLLLLCSAYPRRY
jgi:hypothetical protein